MASYSNDFKHAIIKKATLPGALSPLTIARQHGLPPSTVYGWVKDCGSISCMTKKGKTPQERLKIIIKTSSMPEHELGEYLRTEGLLLEEIKQWESDFYKSQNMSKIGRPKIDPELVELRAREKELSRDLRRKNKALAEMSARVVLLKKSHEIWGTNEDDE